MFCPPFVFVPLSVGLGNGGKTKLTTRCRHTDAACNLEYDKNDINSKQTLKYCHHFFSIKNKMLTFASA